MNVTGKFLLAFLCISIASYGLSGSVYASSHNLLPLSVATNSDSYSAGDMILILDPLEIMTAQVLLSLFRFLVH